MRHPYIWILLMAGVSGVNPPDWASDAIWYQIFPERFHNGDASNDPTVTSLQGTWPWENQNYWKVSPWTSDWYEFQPWENENGQPFNYQFQIRRYGGDIQGIIDKLDYLQKLGINAIYLNPVFDSPSSHKYGATTYRHIDRHFGPDPEGDAKIIAQENPVDPTTWRWTSADLLFLELIQEIHKRNMRIIIDGVFNHVGLTHWAFQDVIKNRENSPYYDWFVIEGSAGDDLSHYNEFQNLPEYFLPKGSPPFRYTGFVADLPAFRQDENGPVEPIRNLLHNIVQRWMDPNGDGDPSDGIDGWRLDVAERVQINFWKSFCGWVKTINPEAYITGEIWWEDYWTNKQFNASPWLTPELFDAVMNYRFTDAMYKYFIDDKLKVEASGLDSLLSEIRNEYRPETAYALQNLLDSHDCERLSSAVVNPDRWLDHANNLQFNKDFDIRKPNTEEQKILRVIVAFQFAYIGAPYIYYGAEVGMWGADDPDCRKPMLWPEFKYDDEVTHPCDRLVDCDYTRPRDVVAVDNNLLEYYKQLIRLRHQSKALRRGTYETVFKNDKSELFAFERQYENVTILAVFNGSNKNVSLPAKLFGNQTTQWELIFGSDTDKHINGKSAIFYRKI